jgi:starch synthase
MECFPAAKSGGLGDVVGALPIYLNKVGVSTSVIIPKYHNNWLLSKNYRQVFHDNVRLHKEYIWFSIEEVVDANTGFPLYVVNMPGKFDRDGVYSDKSGNWYGDEVARSLCFQQAVLKWVVSMAWKPEILHCHDHHTGLIPFMVKYCPEFYTLNHMPTVFTIHNGNYHGSFGWNNVHMLPYFDASVGALMEWAGNICPLAAGIKNAWRVTTVSKGYMDELRYDSNGLEWLINNEWHKSRGILNGIDTKLWDPATDPLLEHKLENDDIELFKIKNKNRVLDRFRIIPDLPIITFIGRLVSEKGADLLPDTIRRVLGSGIKAGFIILGTGEKKIMSSLSGMKAYMSGYFDISLEYNEALAHLLYAGSDFIIMPSRVEPCGLNQMYACRYGTVPIVRTVGGLKDTIIDIGDQDGRGIRFNQFTVEDATMAIGRAVELFNNKEAFVSLQRRIMSVDFSWEKSAQDYIQLYDELT